MIEYETLDSPWPRRQRPAEFDIETTLGHIREMLDDPDRSTFPSGSSFASRDLRNALADRSGYHVPKLQWVHCRNRWCNVDRLAMWVVAVARNGVRIGQLRCIVCCSLDRTTGADKVGVAWPVLRDHAKNSPDCERCGSTGGTELHHWAPSHLFDDSWHWPTSYLCRECHRRWHSVVTPNMSRKIA